MTENEALSKSASRKRPASHQPTLKLVDFKADDTRPDLAVYLLDRAGKLLQTAQVDAKGRFELDGEYFEQSQYGLIGPATEKFTELDRSKVMTFRTRRFREMLKDSIS